jgi:hypothetical protein
MVWCPPRVFALFFFVKKNKAKTRGGHHTIGYTGRRKTKQKHVVDITP